MAGTRTLKKDEYLFRDGDPSDALYVIKGGRLAVVKNRGHAEVHLAELGAGEMIGEMAFFDNQPRSAGAKAMETTEVIVLPFQALNAQFKTFPEWLRAIVRSMNRHLRNANQKLRVLEKTPGDEAFFTPHLIVRLMAILGLVTHRYGEPSPESGESLVVPMGKVRTYTIQVFQLPTNKMQKLLEVLAKEGFLELKDLGEGRVRLTVHRKDEIFEFLEFYNEYLFKEESKRTTVLEEELFPLEAILHFAPKESPEDKVTLNLTEIQERSYVEMRRQVSVDDFDSLIEKGLVGEKVSNKEGHLTVEVNPAHLAELYKHWKLAYTFLRYR